MCDDRALHPTLRAPSARVDLPSDKAIVLLFTHGRDMLV
jgi:hypothetical protein